jgi:hypothetical protein
MRPEAATLRRQRSTVPDSMTSGAFRLKVAAAKTFGLIGSNQGAISLTKLGREIVDPQKAARAKVEAFLTVPLYKELATKYSGILLPNNVGLEREILDLGVVAKQTDKALRRSSGQPKRPGSSRKAITSSSDPPSPLSTTD